jgi:hypothetical protein
MSLAVIMVRTQPDSKKIKTLTHSFSRRRYREVSPRIVDTVRRVGDFKAL